MTITAEVKGCTISLRQPPLAGGTVGDVTVEFHFDEVWNGYTRTAVFRAHGKTVLMLLASDRCTLPPEATAGGDVLLGVCGVCGEKTLTTPFCRLAVAQGVPTAGDVSTGVTPTLAATPGDLSLVLPKRILDGIIEMIYALDKIAPGTANDDTLLYGVEVKFYNMEVALDEHLETPYKGLYVIGDGSGITHSLSHASASGVYVAREILENI